MTLGTPCWLLSGPLWNKAGVSQSFAFLVEAKSWQSPCWVTVAKSSGFSKQARNASINDFEAFIHGTPLDGP